MTDRRTDSSASDEQSRSVGVNALDVIGVTSIKSIAWVTDAKQRACWVQTNDGRNSSVAHILSDVAANVGCNRKQVIACDVRVTTR